MKREVRVKKVAENSNIEAVMMEGPYGENKYVIHQRLLLDDRAKVVVAFIERWAMVAGEQDGEDSAGRQKIRRLTPEELVKHAVETVERLYEACESKGWLVRVPGWEDAVKMVEQSQPPPPSPESPEPTKE